MLPRNHLDRIKIAFDDHRLVDNAGLLLPATLALHLGLSQLVQQRLDLGDAPGRANTGDKMMTLVASALAGGDCIDDVDALRAGGTAGVLDCLVKAPSTLGTFLRSFRWGHVRQLDRVSRELLARAWKAGAGPGDAPLTIDLDSTICETYGLDKEGARHHGYTGKRGYHPLLAVAAGAGDVLMARLREGHANTARGAAHFLRETVGRVRYAGARGQLTAPADSGFYAHSVVSVCRKMDVRFSITLRQHKSLHNVIEAIPEDAWTPIPYWMDGAADVAETTYTPFQSEPDAAPVRLIVRRVKPTPGSQLALFATYSYHGFITDRDGEMLELEADHRRHAEIENAIRDLKYGVGLNHMPSGRFAANGAWLAVQVMAHNLARLDSPHRPGSADRDHQDPQTTGLCLGRTPHPLGTPPHPASSQALALGGAVQPRPGPAASHSTPSLTAPSATDPTSPPTRTNQLRGSSLLLIPWPSAHRSSPRSPLGPCATTKDPPPTSHLPQSSPDHRFCNFAASFQCPHAVHPCPSVDSGLIVCPSQLQDNWNTDRFAEWGIIATTVTMESLPSLADIEEELSPVQQQRLRAELKRYQDQYDVILVDESHNFRNPRTKRYRALMEIIRGGKPDTRVVLMTATPINNSVWDLYHQLMLITRGDDTWYAGRGPIPNLRAAFQAIEKGESDSGLLDTMMLSLVRRTRHDIRAMQEAGETMEVNGQPLRFPEHEIPKAVDYSLQGLYGNIYLDIIDAIEHLNFAVYRLDEYGVETGEKETSAQLRQRNANFVGIMRTILLKRMESSLAALTSTVRSLVDYLNLFLARLEQGHVLTPKQAYKLRAVLGGSLPDHDQDVEDLDPRAVAALQQELAAPEDIDLRARLQVDVALDRDRLQILLTRLQWLEAMLAEQGDPKAQAVRKLLEGLPKEDDHGHPTKVVLFTTYKDTALHLFQQFGGDTESLKSSVRVQSNLEDERWMSLLTGGDDQGRRRAVLERFAPLAAHRETEPSDDPALLRKIEPLRTQSIELLIATDVLSEGQNLQDAQFLVNYDLPWNPVRMIQRAGRIDRLFSPHDRVYIYNLMPEDGLEDLLNLVANLSKKIETIEDAVALDASVLGEQIEAKELDKVMKLRAGGVQADQVYREGERSQGLDEGAELLNRYLDLMKDFATEDIRDIPNGVYSVKKGVAEGVYIMLKMPEEASGEVFWRFYPLGNVAQPITSPNNVLSIVEAGKDELRFDIPADENPFRHLKEPLKAAVDQIGQAYLDAISAVTSDSFTRRIRQFLNRDDLLQSQPDLFRFFNDWVEMPLPSDATRRVGMRDPVRIMNQLAPTRAELGQVVQGLAALRDAVRAEGLDRPIARPETRKPSVEDLELVAWELVVGPDGLP